MEATEPRQTLAARLLAWSPPHWLVLVLFCAALMLRGKYLIWNQHQLRLDPDSYARVAWHVASEWEFSFNRQCLTASRPPLYPLLLAPGATLARRFNWYSPDECGMVGATALHFLFGAITILATWRLARVFGLPPVGGLVAAALVTVDPILLAQSSQVMTETTATALAVLSLAALTRLTPTAHWRWPLIVGALAGLSVLCRPESLVWFGAVLAYIAFRRTDPKRFEHFGLIVLMLSVVVSPWVFRNYLVFGRPIVTTTHGGYTLLLGNNPDFYAYARGGEWGTTWDGEKILRDWNQVLRFGDSDERFVRVRMISTPWGQTFDELAADRWAYGQAFHHIRDEPGLFFYSCVVRVGRLWAVLPHQLSPNESTTRRGLRWAVAIWYVFEFALAAVGVWFLGRKLWRSPWLWGTLLVLSLTAVHAFYWTDMRMRAPLVPVVAFAAAWGLVSLACRFQDPSAYEQPS